MEAASTAFAGPSSEASTPAVYEDDARHFAITASHVPKPAMSMLPPSAPGAMVDFKDMKSIGTRFHEDCHETDLASPRLRSSRLFKGKGKEAVAVEKEKKKPLRLLDLPVDVLKDIVKEVTHTNDLTSLALCHSALHRLTIPHIYSRFDIVWPDTSVHSEPRSGVDALTYGLATLVMAEEIFGEAPNQRPEQSNRFVKSGQGRATETAVRRRRGNHYAQFTKKFSLGNGPADWVQEYLIAKEGGKMLGTLVALAVARMRALETFIWDMPTGILRDVWLALSSLGDRDDGRPCRLEKLWVRWHDNTSADAVNPVPPLPPPMSLNAVPPAPLQSGSGHVGSSRSPLQIHPAALDRVEHPSFSVLPPLKSLSVLDIDELAYLDEMAVLIGRSLDKLKELRVGIARHVRERDWAAVWEGDDLLQVDPDFPTAGSLTLGEKRLGGVLGTLMGFVCDVRRPKVVLPERTRRRSHAQSASSAKPPTPPLDAQAPSAAPNASEPVPPEATSLPAYAELPLEDSGDPLIATSRQASPELIAQTTLNPQNTMTDELVSPPVEPPILSSVLHESSSSLPLTTPPSETSELVEGEAQRLNNILRLDSLELERVTISVPVLLKAIDWTRLTSLTLLHCQNHEQLWKTLRKTFMPVPKSPMYPTPRRTPTSTPRKGGKASVSAPDVEYEYTLKLKKIHTNTVSPSLITFLKETLAPNSLEVLFLQEARSYSSSVTVDAMFRGPLRRHRNSLKKLLIDSSEKGVDGLPTNSSRWRRWMLGREVLGFMCSGKMPALRELGMAIDYRDWVSPLHPPTLPHQIW